MTCTLSALKLGTAMASIALAATGALVLAGHEAPTSHDAWAPEPARLTQDLYGGYTATAGAVYVSTQQPTTVVRWYPDWTAAGSTALAAGAPCVTSGTAAGSTTTKVIQIGPGAKARCV